MRSITDPLVGQMQIKNNDYDDRDGSYGYEQYSKCTSTHINTHFIPLNDETKGHA